ncbi:unnamed protein product, partial [Rotaria sordida]
VDLIIKNTTAFDDFEKTGLLKFTVALKLDWFLKTLVFGMS